MKMNFIAAAIATASILCAGSAFAVDGTITINGKITDTTCDISVNGATNNGTVTLPTVQATALPSSGQVAGSTPFNIKLANCAGTTLGTASTLFEAGSNVDMSTGRLNNSATGTATNVQVQLLNASLGAIKAGAAEASQNDIPVDISSGSATLNYFAQYYATGASTAGTVNTQVDYSIVYQ